jgi:hypothetical protein
MSKAVLIAAAVAVPLLLMFGSLYGKRDEEAQRARVGDALATLQRMIDTAPFPGAQAAREKLRLPRRVHLENPEAARGFAKLIDYTVDTDGAAYEATFGDGQGALSGRTMYLRRADDGRSLACGGTVPMDLLPPTCSGIASKPVASATQL